MHTLVRGGVRGNRIQKVVSKSITLTPSLISGTIYEVVNLMSFPRGFRLLLASRVLECDTDYSAPVSEVFGFR